MSGNLVPVVVIKIPGKYFLYPKKRGNKQKLIELNETGYFFLELYKKFKNTNVMKQKICEEYNITDVDRKLQVERDVQDFILGLEESGLIDNSNGNKSNETELSVASERSFVQQFGKMQDYFFDNNKPFKFFIELTYKCNLRCSHCYRGENVKDQKETQFFLEKKRLLKLFDEIEEMGAVEVILTGGEPFLYPYIQEVLEYVSSKNLIVTILTNGNYLFKQEQVFNIKQLSLFDIRISLYGNEKTHDNMTSVEGSFSKSLQALENVHQYMNLGTGAVVVTKDNFEECKHLISELKQKNINVAVNSSITPTSQGNLEPLKLRISKEQYRNIVEEFNLPLTGTKCTAGISRFRITPRGDVIPCELMPGYSFGNIYDQSLKEIMDGNERKSFVEKFKIALKNHICNNCKLKKECNFCPALFLQENGSLNDPSKYLCDITKQKHEILIDRGILTK